MKKARNKISKRTILIAAILIILVGVPILAYLYVREQESPTAWYSSNWLYRRSVTISNPGGTLTDEDVLVVLDTQTLITAGKLQSDCDDLRFINSNDSTVLTYWIEGGCNTTITQIWVRVPSLTTGSYTIYTYYGNPSATNAEASWSGTFILLANTSCPSGWTRNSSFDSRFPYIDNTYGTTGAGSGASHSHSLSTNTASSFGISSLIEISTEGRPPTDDHTHAIGVATDSASIYPPYIQTYFCNGSKLNLSNGLISFFTSTPPTGWTHFASLDNRYPLGANSYGTTGGVNSHTHSNTNIFEEGTISSYSPDTGDPVLTGSLTMLTSHSHDFSSATVSSGTNTPPYYTVNYAVASGSTAVKVALKSMATSQPPLGWSAFTSANGRMLMGHSTTGTTGGASSHVHSISLTTGNATLVSTTTALDGLEQGMVTTSHTHSVTANSTSVSNIPPYLTVPLFSRKTSLSNTVASYPSGELTPPSAPTQLLTIGQTNPVGIQTLAPYFSAIFNDANTGDTGVYYRIQVNTSSAFDGTSMWDSGKTAISAVSIGARSSDITYNGTALTYNGAVYYWRIKFWDSTADAEGSWSAVAQFTMNNSPNAPTTLYAEGATNPTNVTDTTPEFSAIFSDTDAADTGIAYELDVNTQSGFGGVPLWQSGKIEFITPIVNGARSPDISYEGQTLPYIGSVTYYWRIRFWDSGGATSSWSSTASFIMSTAPYAPTNVTIDGQASPALYLISATPHFTAIHTDINLDNAVYYEVEVNSNNTFTGTVMWDSNKVAMTPTGNNESCPDIVYAGTALTGGGNTYYLRIRFWDTNDNISPWSATASFVDTIQNMSFEGLRLEGLKIN